MEKVVSFSRESLTKKRVLELLPGLVQLKKELQDVEAFADPLEQMYRILILVAPWDDQRKDWSGWLVSTEEHLPAFPELVIHFKDAGRHWNGVNRTEMRETVAPESVILGGEGHFSYSQDQTSGWNVIHQEDIPVLWMEPRSLICWRETDPEDHSVRLLREMCARFVAYHLNMITLITQLETQLS